MSFRSASLIFAFFVSASPAAAQHHGQGASARVAAVASQARSVVAPYHRDRLVAGVPLFTGMTAPQYADLAAGSDRFEILSSQLALDRSRSPTVRDYARTLIVHHTDSTRALLETGRALGLPPPRPLLTPEAETLLATLRSVPREDFDRAFLSAQVSAHQQAWAIHQGYAADGDFAPLRASAATLVPIVEHHLIDAAGRLGL